MKRTSIVLSILIIVISLAHNAAAQNYSVSFKSVNGKYVVAENGGGGIVRATYDDEA